MDLVDAGGPDRRTGRDGDGESGGHDARVSRRDEPLDDSIFCNVVLAAAALDTRIGQFLVTVEAIAAGAVGKAAVTGIATGNVRYGLSGCTIDKGCALIADTVSGLLIPAPAWSSFSTTSSQNQYVYGQKIVGYAMLLTSIASGSATNLTTGIPVWFNGMGGGWGNVAY